ncbi:TBC1 domain family member 31 [Anopheles nili]|uniref:TBC1 domain family member 31 n=1 Tax=Anopheles nili TaxID=185578 RepID=UPI00237B17FE|nr:TBC1 domain family member 31 [Anopheles nili]
MARPTADGRYYALLCCPATVAFLALDSWLICRVVTFSNLFITQFAFVPAVHVARSISETAARCRWPSTTTTTTMGSLVVRTTDNDLMLLNFGQSLRNPPFARSLAVRSEGKCYKFGLAANGRMLANVLQTGEVLLHNLDAYGDTSSSRAVSSLPVTQKARTKGVPVSGLGANYSGKCERASSSSGSCSTATACGTTSGTIAVLRPYDGTREIKLKLQLNALQTKLSKTLPKERLLPILKEYGEYPAKHRATIWRTVQELPGDADTFSGLLRRGYHPCVGDYEHRFASYDQRVVRCLKKTVSCLAHWCPVFGLIDYMPSFVLPFARQQPNDALGLFETVATVLLNQCQLWFEFAPLDPFNYLAMVENVLLECEPRLVAFYRKRNIPSRAYTMPLMETAFAGCVTTAQWLALWDHVLSNEPYFLVFLIAADGSVRQSPDERFPSPASSLAWNDVPTQATTRAYASFCNFPKKLTEIRCTKADAMQAEQRQLEAKIIELEKLEHALQERMVNNLIRQEHEQRVMAVERNLEEAIAKEEQRIEMQRKLLLLHRKQLRERESELSLDVHNAKLINEATVRERELDALLKKFEREVRPAQICV